jgi:hypothetical protein
MYSIQYIRYIIIHKTYIHVQYTVYYVYNNNINNRSLLTNKVDNWCNQDDKSYLLNLYTIFIQYINNTIFCKYVTTV